MNRCFGISDLSALSVMSELKHLVLEQCHQITDLSPLANLTNLQYVNINDCENITSFNALLNCLGAGDTLRGYGKYVPDAIVDSLRKAGVLMW